MRITASRADDLRRQREEFEADRANRQTQFDAQSHEYYVARQSIYDRIEAELRSYLNKFDKLQFDIDVSGRKYISVHIKCDWNRNFDDNCPLSWSYRVEIQYPDGDIRRETSSWSGLRATSAEHLESLKQTVAALEVLNSLDWESIVRTPLPNVKDYVTVDDPSYDKPPVTDSQIFEAELSEYVGTDNFIRDKRGGWIRLEKETPKFYTYNRVPGYYLSRGVNPKTIEKIATYTERMSKDKLMETLDPDNLVIETLDDLIAKVFE